MRDVLEHFCDGRDLPDVSPSVEVDVMPKMHDVVEA